MACPAIITGDAFVTRVLTHIDCQAQLLGSYGYQALGQPGSPASTLMTGLLTLFVALWGIRLLLGPGPNARDVVIDVLKVGIVLTLAFSWPAFRTLIHDVVMTGPAELAASMSTPGLASSAAGFVERLQAVDDGLVSLTELGTGRRSGEFLDGSAVGGTFDGTALEDRSALGWARLVFLSGLIGSLVLLRVLAGLLLALAPLAAGMLLFEATRGLFAGWLRGLLMMLLGSVAITFVLAIELAMLEPLIADGLNVRQLGYATPSLPMELFALVLAFAVVKFAIVAILGKVAFHRGWITLPQFPEPGRRADPDSGANTRSEHHSINRSRAERLSEHMSHRVRMERRNLQLTSSTGESGARPSGGRGNDRSPARSEPSSSRRAEPRGSLSGDRRDAIT